MQAYHQQFGGVEERSSARSSRSLFLRRDSGFIEAAVLGRRGACSSGDPRHDVPVDGLVASIVDEVVMHSLVHLQLLILGRRAVEEMLGSFMRRVRAEGELANHHEAEKGSVPDGEAI